MFASLTLSSLLIFAPDSERAKGFDLPVVDPIDQIRPGMTLDEVEQMLPPQSTKSRIGSLRHASGGTGSIPLHVTFPKSKIEVTVNVGNKQVIFVERIK